MAVSLTKGGNVSLSKEAPGLRTIRVGLGWDARVTDGSAFDLDASVFVLGENGKVRSDADFIFFNNLSGAGGAVVHQGDNLTGEGDGDDEVVVVTLDKLARRRRQDQLRGDDLRGRPAPAEFRHGRRTPSSASSTATAAPRSRATTCREDASTETAMIFGELYRHGGEWKFKAIGQGFAGGLSPLARSFGVNV